VLDRSQSMGDSNKLDQAKAVALAFLRAGNPRNEAFCIAFNDYVGELSDYTSDFDSIATRLAALKAEGGTALYDALLTGLEKLQRSRHQRRALIVITDGSDQHSKHNLNELLRRAQQSDVQIYTVGFYSPIEAEAYQDDQATVSLADGTRAANPKFIFRALAEETGAETYFPHSSQEFTQTITAIAASLRRQYVLAYYLPETSSPNAYRQIEVKVRNSALRIKTRRGFLSAEATELDNTKPLGQHAAALLNLKLAPPPATPPTNAEAPSLYRENFDQVGTHWPQTATTFIKSGRLYVNGEGLVPVRDFVYTDFEMSVTALFILAGQRPLGSGTVSTGNATNLPTSVSLPVLGVSFRVNETGYYSLLLAPSASAGGGAYKLVKIINGEKVDLTSWRRDAIITMRNQIKIKCVGSKLEMYVNNMRLETLQDATHTAGRLSLLFNVESASFDELTIKRLK
jgi:Ca-activated chloride channel family protein